MGTVFEELVRRFNEENNEEAGEHWTPRDAVKLMAKLILLPVADEIESGTYLLYDGACDLHLGTDQSQARAPQGSRDEYHDGYPGVSTPGLVNNAYTNVMAVWVLWRALDVLKLLSGMRRAELTASLRLTIEEIARWDTIRRRMFVPLQGHGSLPG